MEPVEQVPEAVGTEEAVEIAAAAVAFVVDSFVVRILAFVATVAASAGQSALGAPEPEPAVECRLVAAAAQYHSVQILHDSQQSTAAVVGQAGQVA